MQVVFIHIGLEKTGTTSLQAFFTANELQLRRKGFSYLCDQTKPYFHQMGHFPIAASFFSACPDFVPLAKFRSSTEVLAALRQDIEICTTNVILSCEHFSSRLHRREAVESIRRAIGNRPAKIVCYLRRQDELALSAYSTAVRHGRREAFTPGEVKPSVRFYNFEQILDLWSDVFGRANMIVREYDRQRLTGGDIQRDFLNLIGVDEGDFQFHKDQNVALDGKQIEALRLINQHLSPFRKEHKAAYDIAERIRNALIDSLPRGRPLNALLSASSREDIMRRFSAMNSRVATRYLDGVHFPLNIEGEYIKPHNEAAIAITADELAQTIASLGDQRLAIQKRLRECTNTLKEFTKANQKLEDEIESIQVVTTSGHAAGGKSTRAISIWSRIAAHIQTIKRGSKTHP
jgi:hypothetical protein